MQGVEDRRQQRVAGKPEAEANARHRADHEGQHALGQRDQQVLPDGLAEAGVGDAEQPADLDGLLAIDDLGSAVGEKRPYPQRHIIGGGEEKLGQEIGAGNGHARADMPDADGHHRHQRLQSKELGPTEAHAASSA
jgi:hypothetical protein